MAEAALDAFPRPPAATPGQRGREGLPPPLPNRLHVRRRDGRHALRPVQGRERRGRGTATAVEGAVAPGQDASGCSACRNFGGRPVPELRIRPSPRA